MHWNAIVSFSGRPLPSAIPPISSISAGVDRRIASTKRVSARKV